MSAAATQTYPDISRPAAGTWGWIRDQEEPCEPPRIDMDSESSSLFLRSAATSARFAVSTGCGPIYRSGNTGGRWNVPETNEIHNLLPAIPLKPSPGK